MAKRKRSLWAWSIGVRQARARVFERRKGGPLYGWTSADPPGRSRPLGHRDKEKAKQWAKDHQALLQLGRVDVRVRATVATTFTAFLANELADRGESQQKHLTRCATMWTRVLGRDTELGTVTHTDLTHFVRERRTGRIDAEGRAVKTADAKAVRDRTIERDLQALRTVCLWAMTFRPQPGEPTLLRDDPTAGFKFPRERNVRRPVATDTRFTKLLAVAPKVHPAFPALLTLMHETGRRVSAVLQLRRSDLDLEAKPAGAIKWPAETDKGKRAWTAPLTPRARQALDRLLSARPIIGDAPLFPSPQNVNKPMSRWYAADLLRKAETLAKLTPLEGSAWHAYRRAWATKRKHLPVQDVAHAGGWSDYRVLQNLYQQPDPETLVRVMNDASQLREANQ